MPQKVIKFTGINRKVNEFQGAGACEELINLRPNMNGGCNIVKPKKRHIHNISFDYIYRHAFGNTNIDVAVSNGVVYRLINLGAPVSVTSEFQGKGGIEISSAGNVLLIYCADADKMLAFKWENEAYVEFAPTYSPISITTEFADSKLDYRVEATEHFSEGAIQEALEKAISGFNNKYLNGLCGTAIVACTYVLEDNTEVWATGFTIIDPTLNIGTPAPAVELFDNGYWAVVKGTSDAILRISVSNDCDKAVKKINVYSTKAISRYKINEVIGDFDSITYEVETLSLEDVGLFGQQMYYQGSILPKKGTTRMSLKFGTDLSAGDLMPVTSGCIERIGRNVSLNNRFHFFNNKINHVTQRITVTRRGNQEVSDDATRCIAYVKINGKWWLTGHSYLINDGEENYIMYPMLNVEEVMFVEAVKQTDDTITCTYDKVWSVKMNNSTSYNYSYAIAIAEFKSDNLEFYNLIAATGTLWENGYDKAIPLDNESNAINVSVSYNPFAFDINYSYSIGGKILDLVTSYVPISSTQISTFPLTVFTDNGIFAIEQGDGNVLYRGVTPLNPSVLQGSAVPTPYGTFFVSSKNLYVLHGQEAINVSYSQNGSIETKLRENNAYKALCCTESYGFHDFSGSLSNERFEDFITDSVLVYDQLNNEIIVSSTNPDIKYSYVFNLDTKTYFKINKRYLKAQNGGRFVMEASGDINDITDLHSEVDGVKPILLQSRPMQLEALFTHIQRMILYVDAKLEGEQNLCFSVFGSDNLYDWKCIISAQKQNTVLRHIRTNKAAKSYRDYIILISGTVSTDTDISDIIADYTVVSRRLG